MRANLSIDTKVIVTLPGYTILVHEAEEGESGFWGEVLEVPGCVSQGETVGELRANIQEAMEAVLQHSFTSAPDAPVQFGYWPHTETGTA